MKNPVLLIHGFFRNKSVFNKIYGYLTSLGWEVHRINLLPGNGIVGLDKLALQVADYVDRVFPDSQYIDLIGLSMGGLITRYYLQRLGGIERVERFITISAPHQGTYLAYLLPIPGCIQMQPESSFLQDLNRDVEVLSKLDFTSLWTPYDFIIIPPESSQIGVGKDIKIDVFSHAMMVRDIRSLEAIKNALEEPIVLK